MTSATPAIHDDAQPGDYVIVSASAIAGRSPETAPSGDEGQAASASATVGAGALER